MLNFYRWLSNSIKIFHISTEINGFSFLIKLSMFLFVQLLNNKVRLVIAGYKYPANICGYREKRTTTTKKGPFHQKGGSIQSYWVNNFQKSVFVYIRQQVSWPSGRGTQKGGSRDSREWEGGNRFPRYQHTKSKMYAFSCGAGEGMHSHCPENHST